MPPRALLNPSRHRKGLGYASTPAEKRFWEEVSTARFPKSPRKNTLCNNHVTTMWHMYALCI